MIAVCRTSEEHQPESTLHEPCQPDELSESHFSKSFTVQKYVFSVRRHTNPAKILSLRCIFPIFGPPADNSRRNAAIDKPCSIRSFPENP